MKIGLVGYQGCGKSTLFHWLTGVEPDPALSHTTQSAMATVPDPRVKPLCDIYSPKKVTLASIELVDTPGLSRDHDGNAARLGLIREADCLVMVGAAFDGSDPLADVRSLEEDLLLADLEIMSGRVDRLKESLKKPRPNWQEQQDELDALEPLLRHLEEGRPLHELELNEDQIAATRSFRPLTNKPRVVIVNAADDEEDLESYQASATPSVPIIAVRVGLECELDRMTREERQEFLDEMGLESFDRDGLLRTLMDASRQMLFFTAGEKEVRTWMIPKETRAVDAAGSIHTDMARGFIRAETMTCDDMIRLGSEREVKANHLVRQEPKDYIIQDGDILNIKFSV